MELAEAVAGFRHGPCRNAIKPRPAVECVAVAPGYSSRRVLTGGYCFKTGLARETAHSPRRCSPYPKTKSRTDYLRLGCFPVLLELHRTEVAQR